MTHGMAYKTEKQQLRRFLGEFEQEEKKFEDGDDHSDSNSRHAAACERTAYKNHACSGALLMECLKG
jgi:hypothetical protein